MYGITQNTLSRSDYLIICGDFGLVWDNSEVLNEVTACNNVVEKYRAGLLTGCLDPETAIPQMNQELDAAGINTIIEAKQAQLDAWLAEQN